MAAPASANGFPAAALEFSDGFLIGGESIDMQRYTQARRVAAGDYRVEVQVNGVVMETRDIAFLAPHDDGDARACLPAALVAQLSLRPVYLDAIEADANGCVDLNTLIEGATVTFDSSTLQLLISLPQAAQARSARGHVAPAQRDYGIPAAFVDYSANYFRSQGRQNTYLGLRTGVNLGAWRLRHRSSLNRRGNEIHHQRISTSAQRDLPHWNSQLLLGHANTGGEWFESVAFTGVRLATDERMLPDSMRGYAPTVHGVAEGTAMVTIRQNGLVIHESTVAPGPFLIDDLYPTNFGGDLQVTVTEADGRQQQFNVNFSAVPQALRPGASRYSATVGALREEQFDAEPLRFIETTYAHGLSNRVTLLGGLQSAQSYHSLLAGAAVNTAVGAFGVDVTRSRAQLPRQAAPSGLSYRVNYQRYLASTGTNVGLAAYRYSTHGYLTLSEAARARGDDWSDVRRARQRYQLNFTQRLSERSSLYFSGGHVSFWDGSPRRNDFQMGFQSRAGRANYSVSALRYQWAGGKLDTRYAVAVSLPLGRSESAPRLGSQLSRSARGAQAQLALNGALGERRALSYSVAAGTGAGTSGNTSAYATYQGGAGTLSGGFTRSGGVRSQTLGAAGSLAVHAGGLNAGQPVGDGFALVQAIGAEGAAVGSSGTLRVARNGYALLPHISPYRWNRIELDPTGLAMDVQLVQSTRRVAPTAGGIVRVPFEVRRERTLFIDATDALGQPLPFGARVHDAGGRLRGAVGQGGVIQVRGMADQGELIVDPDGPHHCRLTYRMPEQPDAYGLSWSQASCRPLGALQVPPR